MKAPDLLEIHARKLLGRSEPWRLCRYETIGHDTPRPMFKLTGSVPSTVMFKSGPRKGQPNWKHATDEQTVYISEPEQRAFEAAWEKETGLCKRCGDTGEELERWSTADGATYRPCTRCPRGARPAVAP